MEKKTKKTWDEMYNFLKFQDNCAVFGAGFRVKDLHYTLDKYKGMIGHHNPDDRLKSLYCQSLKGSLERIYNAYKEGNIDPVNTTVERPFATRII